MFYTNLPRYRRVVPVPPLVLRAAVEGALPPLTADAIASAARGGGDRDAGHAAHQMLLDVLQEGVRGVTTGSLNSTR